MKTIYTNHEREILKMNATETSTEKKWGTQTWIGQRYGLSAVAVGKILTRVGLKKGPEATSKALLTGHAKRCLTSDDRPYFMWDFDGVSEIVEEALVQNGGPKIGKIAEGVRVVLEEAQEHRNEGNGFIADLLEEEAYADLPSGLARVVRRNLDR